jgi:hypothetical protein
MVIEGVHLWLIKQGERRSEVLYEDTPGKEVQGDYQEGSNTQIWHTDCKNPNTV